MSSNGAELLQSDRTSTPEPIPNRLPEIQHPFLYSSLSSTANAISRQQLRSIANGVAGVARFGIRSLRAAAEIADERGHSEILD